MQLKLFFIYFLLDYVNTRTLLPAKPVVLYAKGRQGKTRDRATRAWFLFLFVTVRCFSTLLFLSFHIEIFFMIAIELGVRKFEFYYIFLYLISRFVNIIILYHIMKIFYKGVNKVK